MQLQIAARYNRQSYHTIMETTMDAADFIASKLLLTLANNALVEAVARAVPVLSFEELQNLRDNRRTCEADVADFIVPNLDGNGEIDISG
jgi:hypothetical protein